MRRLAAGIGFASLALVYAAASAESPSFNYTLHCQGCHLADGRATPGRIPALVGVGRFLAVAGGREYLVRVPGVSLSVIEDDELAELVTWVLYRFSGEDVPSDFEPYTAEEIARYRRRPLVDVERVRSELVAALERVDEGPKKSSSR